MRKRKSERAIWQQEICLKETIVNNSSVTTVWRKQILIEKTSSETNIMRWKTMFITDLCVVF